MKRKKMMTRFLAAAMLAGLLLTGRSSEAIRAVTPDGKYKVGVRVLYLDLEGRKAPVMIWYPARPAAGAAAYDYRGAIHGAAVLNADPESTAAPYPLLLFSHGLGGCGCQSVFYTENLASAGYVVVAPDHKDSAMCHIDRDPDITAGQIVKAALTSGGNLGQTVLSLFGEQIAGSGYDFSYRFREAGAAIDQALAWNRDPDSSLHNMMDPDRIGVTGHSLGGMTTLVVGGVPYLCDQPEDKNPADCDSKNFAQNRMPNPCCFPAVRELQPFQFRDSRVKAMLSLAPAVLFPHPERAAKEIKIPMMIITGDNRKMEVPWTPIWNIYQNAPAPKYLVRLQGTDHMTVADFARGVSVAKYVLPGFRSHYADKAQAYQDYSVGFFNLYLQPGPGPKNLQVRKNNYAEYWGEEPK